MKRINQISLGINTYGQAFRFILRNRMGWTFLFPVILSIILLVSGELLITNLVDFLKDWVVSMFQTNKETIWAGLIGGFAEILLRITAFLVLAYLSGYVIIILMSPLLAYVSEKTENIINGKSYNFELKQFISDIFRGILIALRNLIIEMMLLVLGFFASFIPVIGWFTTIFLFIVSSYFYGFSFIDYTNERKKLSTKESVKLVRKYKWLAIANGSAFSFFLVVPWCGQFISTFAAIVATVAATIAILKTDAYSLSETQKNER
ncbi:MAG: EI24 domain-containing protein [Bacteroidales bacterium]